MSNFWPPECRGQTSGLWGLFSGPWKLAGRSREPERAPLFPSPPGASVFPSSRREVCTHSWASAASGRMPSGAWMALGSPSCWVAMTPVSRPWWGAETGKDGDIRPALSGAGRGACRYQVLPQGRDPGHGRQCQPRAPTPAPASPVLQPPYPTDAFT